jgi:hypothetical protein
VRCAFIHNNEDFSMSQSLSLLKVLNPQAGWYRGDFHAHTHYSDGIHTPAQLVEVARAEGLDFITITDHNTIDALSKFGEEPTILIIPGLEVTLKEGHFNVFGMEGWLDWMEHILTGKNMPELTGIYGTTSALMQRTSSQGLLNSINHPLLPWKPPLEWRDRATDLRYLDCLEIWNDPSSPDNLHANPKAVALWTDWLNAGYRITAIGGSDYHQPVPEPGQDKPPERLGLPSTYVYAEQLSGAAILEGLRRRRAYVSMGARVTFQAQADHTTYEIGADLGELSGAIDFKATVTDCPSSARAQIVKNGHVISEVPVEGGQASLRYSADAMPTRSDWYRLHVADREGQMLAMTNPIFVGPRRTPDSHTYGDFVSVPNGKQP